MLVVDASVVTKLLLDEEHTDRAKALFVSTARRREEVAAPALLVSEIANVVLQRVRRGRISSLDAEQLLTRFDALAIAVVRDDLHHQAVALALRHNLPAAYDAHYLALVEQLGCEFWTADERLVNALRSALPGVRWLGSVASAWAATATRGLHRPRALDAMRYGRPLRRMISA